MQRSAALVPGFLMSLHLAACGGGGGGGGETSAPAAATNKQVPAAPVTFVDATAESGIAYRIGYSSFAPQTLRGNLLAAFATGGVAAGDYDSDGDVDLFITRGDIGPNLLYQNNGSALFVDVAAAAGVAYTATASENYRHSGPAFADMDGDADLDLFIGGLFGDPSFVFMNNGDGTFSDVTAGSGIDTLLAEHNIAAAFGDYDLDGDLDMLLAHWGAIKHLNSTGDTEHLWRNDSHDGTIVFSSVSLAAGIAPSVISLADPLRQKADRDWTFTPVFARIDSDLYPEVLIVADFNRTQFFSNNRDGSFTNSTDIRVLTDNNGMGTALGDYDNDGDLDWFVSSISFPNIPGSGNRFYQNDNGVFVDQTINLGVIDGGWGWGACFMDFENDGDLDIYQTNGWDLEGDFTTDVTRAFVGSGGGRFVDRARSLGLDDTDQGRGIVCADFDNDGDVDLFQLHRDSHIAATMWRNDTQGNNYLRFKLRGLPPNTEAAGARIFVTVGGTTQMREIRIGNNFVSQNPTAQVFGLGIATQADEVRVEWPDGLSTILGTVPANQNLILHHPNL